MQTAKEKLQAISLAILPNCLLCKTGSIDVKDDAKQFLLWLEENKFLNQNSNKMNKRIMLPVFAVIAALAIVFGLSAFKGGDTTKIVEKKVEAKKKHSGFVFVKKAGFPENLASSYVYSEAGTECDTEGSSVCAVENDDDDQLDQQELNDILNGLDGTIYKRTP
jgi:hypothetical protein